MNNLQAAFKVGKAHQIINGIISQLGDYALEHLSYEEEYMKKHNYPGLASHKKIHQEYLKRYAEFKTEINKKSILPLKLTFEVREFLEQWWTNHILKVDHLYYEFVRNKKKQ